MYFSVLSFLVLELPKDSLSFEILLDEINLIEGYLFDISLLVNSIILENSKESENIS